MISRYLNTYAYRPSLRGGRGAISLFSYCASERELHPCPVKLSRNTVGQLFIRYDTIYNMGDYKIWEWKKTAVYRPSKGGKARVSHMERQPEIILRKLYLVRLVFFLTE